MKTTQGEFSKKYLYLEKHSHDLILCNIYPLLLFSFLLTSFPLIIINITMHLADMYLLPIMPETFYWAPLMLNIVPVSKMMGGRHICIMEENKSHKKNFINRRYFSWLQWSQNNSWLNCALGIASVKKYCFVTQEGHFHAWVKLLYSGKLAYTYLLIWD